MFQKVILERNQEQQSRQDREIEEERVLEPIQESSFLIEQIVSVDANFSKTVDDFDKSEHEASPGELQKKEEIDKPSDSLKSSPATVLARISTTTPTKTPATNLGRMDSPKASLCFGDGRTI
ncbi:hypothetical protein RYX36_030754 [Vicia faba]